MVAGLAFSSPERAWIVTQQTIQPLGDVDWAVLQAGLRPSAYRRLREVLDPVLASIALLVALPLLGIVALAIRLDSPGPVLFRQLRGGRLAVPFVIVKFRTMRADAAAYSVKVDPDDPAITRVGRLLRASGLDELPQLWNVARGEMGLIGPRPEQYPLLAAYEPWQHERHVVKPGVTGWWQVNHRDAEPIQANVERDLHYVRNQGLALDALIVVRTLGLPFAAVVSAVRRGPRPGAAGEAGPDMAERPPVDGVERVSGA